MRGLGIGVRGPFWHPLVEQILPVNFVEVTAEHFFDDGDKLAELRDYDVAVHSLAMSLGSPEDIDKAYLSKVLRIASAVDAPFVSDHLAFTKTANVDLGHLNPIPLNNKMFSRVRDKVEEVQQIGGRRFLLENITAHLSLCSPIEEPEFLSELSRVTGCGVLLDITNLYVNARNHGFDPYKYLNNLDLGAVCQIHLIGYSRREGMLQDDHAAAIQSELLEMLSFVLGTRPEIPVLIEWDRNFPTLEALKWNLYRVHEVIDGCSQRHQRAVSR